MEKDNKKKTLTISSDLKKKIDTEAINTNGKKSFAVKKKGFMAFDPADTDGSTFPTRRKRR